MAYTHASGFCPTCGNSVEKPNPSIEAARLLDVLTNGFPHREVYRGEDGRWYVTYGHGEVSKVAVRHLIKTGSISSVYDDMPEASYHVGKTIDTARTKAARAAKTISRKSLFYVGDRDPAPFPNKDLPVPPREPVE